MENKDSSINNTNKNDAESLLHIARSYYQDKKFEEAFLWYQKAMEMGHPDGMNGVGLCYYNGLGVSQSKEKGERYLRLAIENGSTKAMCNLASFIDSQESGDLYMKAANLGNSNAQLKIGHYYMQPQLYHTWQFCKQRDTIKAFDWFMKSALQGNRIAQYEVGLFFEKGIDPCVRNIEKSLIWFKKAADQHLKTAIFAIGRLYANGIDDLTPDYYTAFAYYKQAADAGLKDAQYRTGIALFYGKGVKEDKKEAYSYLLKAAEQGCPDAQYYVAVMLISGQGVEKNLDLAEKWLQENGISSSMEYESRKFDLLLYLDRDESDISITECTPIDLAFAQIDSSGVLYSQDGKKLLRYAIDDAYFDIDNGLFRQQTLTDYEIPSGVEIICDQAFEDCESIERIKIPNSVLNIGERAFYNCENLSVVQLSSTIKTLRDQTFYGCTSLREICLPASIEVIENSSLVGVRELTSESKRFVVIDSCLVDSNHNTLLHFNSGDWMHYTIPEGIRRIESYAFSMSLLFGVSIPDTIEEIGYNAFEFCNNLTDVEFCHYSLNPQLKKICCGAFHRCDNLEHIILPEGLEIIDTQAFSYCMNLKIVILPDSLVEIGNLAFVGSSLISITLPENLKYLGFNAFAGSKLVEITSNTPLFKVIGLSIYNAEGNKLLQYYGKDENYRVPTFVSEIGDFAFGYSYVLKCLEIPSNVIAVGKRILEQSYPKKIIIPILLLSAIKASIEESMYDRIQISEKL